MKYRSILFALCLCIHALGQKGISRIAQPNQSTFCRASFENILLKENNTNTIIAELQNRLPNLKDKRCSLKLNYVQQSLAGIHYSFTQLFGGIPVYQSEIKVNMDKKNTIVSIFDNSYETSGWSVDVSSPDSDAVVFVDAATNLVKRGVLQVINHATEVVQVNGSTDSERNLNVYYLPSDSIVSGKVFNPDPLTTAHQVYGGIYINNLDSDAPWLDAQEQVVQFKAHFNDTVFSLKSDYIHVMDFDSPRVTPATSFIPQFYFNRSQTGFEDVNAFYHLSTYHNYIAAMGFNCVDSILDIDTHANSGGFDNSFFAPDYSPPRIYYSTGGVPDAQDADVLVHEYAHFMSENASPNSNVGSERTALDEAFGDYNAASYSKSINTYHDEWVYNWDGHNEFWSGRIVNATTVYPTDLTTNIYTNGEIWSSMLFSLNGDLGRGATDSLIIETHYSYAKNISMAYAAQLLLKADTLLNNGINYCAIYKRLLEHGFVSYNPANPCGILGLQDPLISTIHFMQNGESFTIMNTEPGAMSLNIYTITGQRLATQITINANQAVFTYSNNLLSAGVYIVNVQAGDTHTGFKWVKLK